MGVKTNAETGGISKAKLYEATENSGVVTSDMTADEMLDALSDYFTEESYQLINPWGSASSATPLNTGIVSWSRNPNYSSSDRGCYLDGTSYTWTLTAHKDLKSITFNRYNNGSAVNIVISDGRTASIPHDGGLTVQNISKGQTLALTMAYAGQYLINGIACVAIAGS